MTAGREALDHCLEQCGPKDSILFLDAGVVRVLELEGEDEATAPCPAYYLAADLRARGLLDAAAARKALLADDAQFVQLLCQHQHCLSWK
jgi:sulfur relay protein TusB/DsrH